MSGIRENLKLCTVIGCIPICSRAGYQTAIILRQPTTGILITDTGRIVKTAFSPNRLKIEDFGHRKPDYPSVVFKNRLLQGNPDP